MIDPRAMKQALIIFFLSLFIIIASILMQGCGTAPVRLDVTTYAGDSANSGISRSQEEKTISCSDPAIDKFICMDYDDLKMLFLKIQSCQEFEDGD